jgi:hypothetical protein
MSEATITISNQFNEGKPEYVSGKKMLTVLNEQQEQKGRERVVRPTGKTDACKDLMILAKERRIKELEEENRWLKKELQTALGKAYDGL